MIPKGAGVGIFIRSSEGYDPQVMKLGHNLEALNELNESRSGDPKSTDHNCGPCNATSD